MRTINSFILLCVFCLFCQPILAQRRVRLADLPPFERAVVVVKYFFCVLIKGLTNLKFFQSMPHSRATLYLIYIGQPSSSDV